MGGWGFNSNHTPFGGGGVGGGAGPAANDMIFAESTNKHKIILASSEASHDFTI